MPVRLPSGGGGLAAIAHDATLEGSGPAADPLGVGRGVAGRFLEAA